MAQAVEIHIRPGVNGHQCLPLHSITCHVLLDPGHGQGTGRLSDRAGIVVDVLDCRAQLVTADGYHFVDKMPAQLEAVGADLRHRYTVGKGADLRQDHPFPGGQGGLQAVGVLRLDADHLHLWAQVLHVGGDTSDQPPPPTGTKMASSAPGC